MGASIRITGSLVARCALAALVSTTLGCESSEPPVARLAVAPETIEIGFPEALDVDLEWSMLLPLDGRTGTLRVFVHALDSDGELVRTFDHGFPEPWSTGGTVRYAVPIYQSAIAPALPGGRYAVRVGLYDESGRRWPLDAPGATSNDAYGVAELVVSDAAGDLPTFSFSAAWLPEEVGGDRQILARRWLTSDGSLRVSGVRQPGVLWLRLAAPAVEGADASLVLDEGDVQPGGVVTTSCSDATERFALGEIRELRLPIAEECDVLVSTNYEWQESDGVTSRSVALEGIAWIRGE